MWKEIAILLLQEENFARDFPDWNPVIDTVPGSHNVVFAVGFSGTGFKLGPVTGRMLADLAQGKEKKQMEPKLSLARLVAKGKL